MASGAVILCSRSASVQPRGLPGLAAPPRCEVVVCHACCGVCAVGHCRGSARFFAAVSTAVVPLPAFCFSIWLLLTSGAFISLSGRARCAEYACAKPARRQADLQPQLRAHPWIVLVHNCVACPVPLECLLPLLLVGDDSLVDDDVRLETRRVDSGRASGAALRATHVCKVFATNGSATMAVADVTFGCAVGECLGVLGACMLYYAASPGRSHFSLPSLPYPRCATPAVPPSCGFFFPRSQWRRENHVSVPAGCYSAVYGWECFAVRSEPGGAW